MKRTNLMLNEEKAREVKLLLGADSISAAVNLALEETIKLYRIRGLTEFFGKGIWEGDLSAMREDKRPTRFKRKKKKT